MFEFKRLSPDGIERSLDKAHHYRLLNEPEEAESICLDVLAIAPDNQRAVVTLLLALTDQFPHGAPDCVRRAQDVLPRLDGEYERAYFAGIIAERRANVRLIGHASGSEAVAFDLFRQAMDFYERAAPFVPQATTMRSCAGIRVPGKSCGMTFSRPATRIASR